MREEHAQFEAVLANLERIAKFITEFMETSGLSEEQVYHFEISTDEHVSNLIEHAFKNRSNPLIDITCREDADKAQVIICDDSAGFDPRNYTVPDLENQPIYEIPPGGFGNYFICKLMDEVEYIHHPYVKNKLILTMLKHAMNHGE
ncbi:MAG: ATP-binding protein [Candidatus Vecturithrix sp.]|jgi:anti-sigma regulatory factor (Ser/Thr protein kinase)|nr:ATP-binding protein [Candidatus Vecturithrix sp.]